MLLTIVLTVIALLIAADQMIKIWVLQNLAGNPSQPAIPHLLQLTYVENRGAAFGILQGRGGILSVLTLAIIIVLLVLLIRKKFHKSPLVMWCVALIIAGGIGNLIDRILRGFVVDYLDISPLFNFPVFNLADCCVVIGTFLLMFYLFFLEGRQTKKNQAKDIKGDGEAG